jgi:hypothetical protein
MNSPKIIRHYKHDGLYYIEVKFGNTTYKYTLSSAYFYNKILKMKKQYNRYWVRELKTCSDKAIELSLTI